MTSCDTSQKVRMMDENIIKTLTEHCKELETIVALQAKEIQRLNNEVVTCENINIGLNKQLQDDLREKGGE